MRRDFGHLCERAGLGSDWTTYELRHSFVSLVADQLDDLVKVADLAGHRDPRTTQGYRHPVRSSLPHAIEAWEALLAKHPTALVTIPPSPGRRKRRLVRPEERTRRSAARDPGHACSADRLRSTRWWRTPSSPPGSTCWKERAAVANCFTGCRCSPMARARMPRGVLDRFRAAPMFVEAPVGAIRAAGFEVIPTGTGADHFDVQLIVGVTEADPLPSEAK